MIKLKQTKASGFTLIEVLIGLLMTLIVLGAMLSTFFYASKEMAKGRASVSLSKQLTVVEDLLRRDLERLTLPPRVWMQTAEAPGYFEYWEGGGSDSVPIAPGTLTTTAGSFLGDIDDVLAFTIRSDGAPFQGRLAGGGVVSSNYAEVIWFTVHFDRDNDGVVDFDERVDLCRRQLVIAPTTAATLPLTADFAQLKLNDVSYRIEGGTSCVPNTLFDLANRANRFCHAGAYPHFMQRLAGNPTPATPIALENTRRGVTNPITGGIEPTGDDVVLTNVTGFDVKAFFKTAAVATNDTGAANDQGLFLEPNDKRYPASDAMNSASYPAGFTPSAFGAFSDLTTIGAPNRPADWIDPLDTTATPTTVRHVYDTWWNGYEVGAAAFDGIDNDGANGVDDLGERTAVPPYLDPLTGIKIMLRVVDKNAKQVRQTTVIHSFIPE